ncbi:MAG: rhomboid family intramembrane serine protease [Proteobacteria bacterium]|nr:rhomboid family intramembrane serine protease [Pseudomonadota bacterium]MBU1060687.1 rhomboid family intramembrane serine protease [Pseudomonadota bacterium]
MTLSKKRNSFLCPNCRRLVSRSESVCPACGLKNPGSLWNDNIFTRGLGGEDGILKVIIVVNIAMFMLSLALDPRTSSFSASPFNFLSPSNNSLFVLGSTGTIPLFQFNRWWSLISASYLHGSLMHIVFNMIALYQIGPLLLREYGTSRMIAIYTLSGIGGYLISVIFGVRLTIGASAAVCGLIGAALYYGKSRGGAYGNAVYSQIGGWALGIFLFGFMIPGINNWGHAGGMLVGALVGFILGYRERSREKTGHKFLSMICIVCTGAVLFWPIVNGVFFLLR